MTFGITLRQQEIVNTMTTYKSEFINTIVERGYLHQCTDMDALDLRASGEVISAYIGFDCTAPSLHAGSLLPIMLLRKLQQNGHKPIVLMGAGTTKVGDPTGKDESRKVLSDEEIDANLAGIRKVFAKYLTFGDGPTDAIMVNNDDWLQNLQYLPFLRDYGRHFSINRMMTFDSVKLRLEREQPLSFLEFNYMILQAYDFLELARRNDCCLQMGGSDQWGNIVNGVELGRRCDNLNLFGLTTPLLTTSSGAKMGKTADGAVWLNSEMLSPYDYWQYWRNAEDADVGRLMRLFTELPLDEIARLEKLQGAELNDAKKILATEVTAMCHGREAADQAADTARKTFEEGTLDGDLPFIEVDSSILDEGIVIYELFRQAGLANSNGEARRLIKGGGGRINDQKIEDEVLVVTCAHTDANGTIKLSAGKKRHALVKVS